MADPKIRIRRSATPNKVPQVNQLQLGELAINTFDGKLYLEQDQTGGGGINTVIAVNPWSVGVGSLTYNTFFNAGSVGINSSSPGFTLDVGGDINFTGNLRQNGSVFSTGIGIQSGGNVIVGSGATTLNFVGSAVSTITESGGVVELNITAGEFTKSTSNFTASAGQTTFNVNYTPNYVDVFVNGVRLTASEFTATNGTSVVLSEGANLNDVVDIVVYQNSGLFDGSKWTAETPATPSSGNIYRMSGNVGIATTNPTSKLHILGDALVSGVVTATGGFNLGISSAGTTITSGPIKTLNFIGTGNTFLYNSSTDVIDISISGGSALSISTSTTATAQDIGFVGGASTSIIGIAGAANRFVYVPSTGRLGLGTDSPTQNLQVGSSPKAFVVSGVGSIGINTTTTTAPIDLSGVLGIQATVTGIQTTAATTIDTLPIATYRSARFQVQITQSTDYQSTDLMTVHDGTTATNIEYGSIATNDMLASFSSTISGSNLLLRATMVSAGIATVKVVRYGVTV